MPEGQAADIPQGVREAIWNGVCMDRLYRRYGRVREQLRHIVLAGTAEVSGVAGFQEFFFDLLANFPAVKRLTVELSCLTGEAADAFQMMLHQFGQVYPERTICLEMRAPAAAETRDGMVCDLWTYGGTS